MCVYFIQAEQGGLIKIGHARDPQTRLYNLQMSCPIKLKILATIEDVSYGYERNLHNDLSQYRQYGEWFEPAREVLKVMTEKATPFTPGKKPTFDNDETIIINGKKRKRCKGYSSSRERRCKRSASLGEYCALHKP